MTVCIRLQGACDGTEVMMNGALRSRAMAARSAFGLGAVIPLLMLAPAPAHAQGAWCATYSLVGGGTSCRFRTLDECRADVSGVGGTCAPNYRAGTDKRPRRKARRGTQ
jgi:hypothetical protein